MPQPTQSQVHIDAPLTNMSVAYRMNRSAFIAPQVFPEVPVNHQTDLFWKYTKNDWFRDEAEVRADATESVGSGYNLSTDSYAARVWAFHKDIGRQARANADPAIDLERDATEFVTDRLLLRMERLWAASFFATTKWGTDYTGVAGAPAATEFIYWNDYAFSNPIGDVAKGRRKILAVTGLKPNTMVMGYDVFEALKWHPDVRDVVKYTSAEMVTTQLLARLFEVDRILVAESIYATNNEGATEAYDFIHGKHMLLCYVNPRPSLLSPSAGYTFAWRGVSEGLGTTVGISRIDMPLLKAVRVEGEFACDLKVIASDLGVFYSGAVS